MPVYSTTQWKFRLDIHVCYPAASNKFRKLPRNMLVISGVQNQIHQMQAEPWDGFGWLSFDILVYCLFIAGVHHVFDETFARDFSLLQSQKEFMSRFRRQESEKGTLPMLASACPGNFNNIIICFLTLTLMCIKPSILSSVKKKSTGKLLGLGWNQQPLH